MTVRGQDEVVERTSWRRFLAFTSLVLVALWSPGAIHAQTPVSITDSSTPIAFTTNNTGSASTYVLNADSSVSVLNSAGITVSECPAFLTSTTLLQGAIYFDASSSRVYIATQGNPPKATYNTINADGSCTSGPSAVSLVTGTLGIPAFGGVGLGFDCCVHTGQGNVYVVVTNEGAVADALFILSTSDFGAAPAQVGLDYAAAYGPIIVDSSSHTVYINDFGASQNGPPGFNATPGFFVYDPENTNTPNSNIVQVMGYVNPAKTTVNIDINAQTLLANGEGKLIIVNQNTSPASALTFISSPFTILDTTQFSFFSNTQSDGTGGGSEPRVFIEPPAAAVDVIPATLDFSATSAADIDATNGIVYAFAYDATEKGSSIVPVTSTGNLFSYNLSNGKETLLADDLSIPAVTDSGVAPWSQLTFNSKLDDVMLFTPSGALGVSSPLTACTPIQVDQVLGGSSTSYSLTQPAFNFTNGYIYDAETVSPNTSLFYVVPPSKCATSTLTLSPTSLTNGVAGQPYGPVTFTATNSGTSVSASFSASGLPEGTMGMSAGGILSGTPTQVGPFEVAVMASDSNGDMGSETVPFTVGCPTITVGPSNLPGGIIGESYNVSFTESGGVGSITFAAFGPFPPGISANSSGLSGIPTQAGTTIIGVQATDSNGCKSAPTTPLTVSIATPTFSMLPANTIVGVGFTGSGQCPKGVFGFPTNVPPIVSSNGVSYFQVQLYLYNAGNVPANANLTSATLGGFQPLDLTSAGIPDLPIIFNNPGTLLQPGGCVALSLYYPTNYYGNPVPEGKEVPLKLQGTYSMTTTLTYQGTWSLTDRTVLLSTPVTVGRAQSATEQQDAKSKEDLVALSNLSM